MKHIYMVGIKGVGMTSLALVYHGMGYAVSGSDVAKKFITDITLQKHRIKVCEGFDVCNIPREIDFAVVSGAHAHKNNPEYTQLVRSGIPLVTHAEALGKLMEAFGLKLSVCGSHGKTTTSAMLTRG